MAANNDAGPLLFLTTSTGSAPSGRNARAHSRATSAKRSNPAAAHYGSFGSFAVNKKHKPGSNEDTGSASSTESSFPKASQVKRRKVAPDGDVVLSRSSESTGWLAVRQQEHFGSLLPPLRILATHFSNGCTPLPPNVDLDNVLKVAAFHIRRKAAQLLESEPERALDALRCRQWCSVPATMASLGRSPYLDGAIACVVSKVQQVVSGAPSEQRILICYTDALHLLRAAVQDSATHERVDMLAASQLLAVYEMLDSPTSSAWARHIAGVAAMSKLQATRKNGILTSEQAAPMFVEALLNDDDGFFESKQWKALLQILTNKQSLNPQSTGETLSCFRSLRILFADWKSATRISLGWEVRFNLLAQAHELRAHFKNVVFRNEHRFMTRQQISKGCDVLGLCLVSIMMLDRLILTLRQTSTWQGHNLEIDTQELCTQVIRHELDTAEAFPAKDLLRAFQKQHDYPLLEYDS
ncbi:hypothetical protein CB0940_08321 [Cercospora beticola]|uniref:Uncharacterized protein n=2 Tax=Cercospora beticola TaxID=122368 RepID=A0A2G5HR52_CERBT|nr:hypothetical protein CB0940_08321 [Cercospora beticola]PIA94998.1 hypothetical protein CB0940_08321 [Cercospora beticola]CAK1364660.1 unnamed protein product [Cercospora beticola]